MIALATGRSCRSMALLEMARSPRDGRGSARESGTREQPNQGHLGRRPRLPTSQPGSASRLRSIISLPRTADGRQGDERQESRYGPVGYPETETPK
jgi:hypothetical protein